MAICEPTTNWNVTAAEMMTENPISIREEATFGEAVAFLINKGFRAAPVIDASGRPVGVISQSDIITHEHEKDAAQPGGEPIRVKDLMTPAVFQAPTSAPLGRLVEEMVNLNVHRLYVVGADGLLVGVITALDLLNHMYHQFRDRATEPDEVPAALRRQDQRKERAMLPIRTILHATDLTDNSDQAFRWAEAVARVSGARLIVLHARSAEHSRDTSAAVPDATTFVAWQEALHQRHADPAQLKLEVRSVDGPAAETILRVARESNADLIVLGTHGRTGLSRLLVGSVAEGVIRNATCPVLAVKSKSADQGLAVSTIIHPTDFSAQSEQAFRLTCLLARQVGARLVILHVRTAAKVDLYGGEPVVELLEAHDAKEEAKLRSLASPFKETIVEHRLVQGSPAEEILRVANEATGSLIVMGTHGRGGLGRLLMGSVAEQVLRRATCPVLLVKMPAAEALDQ